jgi:putative hydrolase of the HAD superfamily
MSWAAALIDLYDTLAWTEWPAFNDLICQRLDIDKPTLLGALARSRPARSVGTYANAEGDMAAVLAELGIDDPAIARDLASMEFEFFSQDRVHLFGDSLPAVEELRARGVPTALVSNCSHGTRRTVQRLGLDRAFDAVILSFEVRAMKPQPKIYRTALAALEVTDAAASVFVDDQIRYCDGARALGLDTRVILRPGVDPAEGAVADTNGHAVITDLRRLLD